MRTYLVANDFHFPWADKRLLKLWLGFKAALKPDGVVLNGDLCDAACLSLKFDDVRTWRKYTKFREELTPVQRFLDILGECELVEGNHEDRLTRYIRAKADQLDFVNLPELLALNARGIGWTPYCQSLRIGKLHVTHGHYCRNAAGATARAHLDAMGVNVLMGHSHRGGSYFKTNMAGTVGAWENFCMCRMDKPAHLRGQNWQQGWTVVYADGPRFHVVQVPVIGYRFVFGGRLFTEKDGSNAKEVTKLLRSLPS